MFLAEYPVITFISLCNRGRYRIRKKNGKLVINIKFNLANNRTGSGGYYVFSAYELDGLTMFRVMPLGQPPSFNQLGALEAYSVVIENKKADVVFSVKSGDILRLRGAMDYRKANGYDTGITSRVFRT